MLPGVRGIAGRRLVTPGSIIVDTTGAYNFLVPDFDTLLIELWGPGGPGAAGGFVWNGAFNVPVYGAGGGAGGYCAKTYRSQVFSPGSLLACVVGSPWTNTTVTLAGLTANTGANYTPGGASGGDTNLTGGYGTPGGGLSGPSLGGTGAGPGGGGSDTAPGGGGHGIPGVGAPGTGASGRLKFTWS